MIGPGSKVRWKKWAGRHEDRPNLLDFLAMGDVVMDVVEKHPKVGFKGSAMWKVRGSGGFELWVPESELWELR